MKYKFLVTLIVGMMAVTGCRTSRMGTYGAAEINDSLILIAWNWDSKYYKKHKDMTGIFRVLKNYEFYDIYNYYIVKDSIILEDISDMYAPFPIKMYNDSAVINRNNCRDAIFSINGIMDSIVLHPVPDSYIHELEELEQQAYYKRLQKQKQQK